MWAIVNNAGFNVMGDVEWLTVPLYHKAVNVNFYGAVRVTREFLYLVRKAKGKSSRHVEMYTVTGKWLSTSGVWLHLGFFAKRDNFYGLLLD